MRSSFKVVSILLPALLAAGAAVYLWWPEKPASESFAATSPSPESTGAQLSSVPPLPLPPSPPPRTGPRFSQGVPYQAPTLIKRVPKITTITAADVERDFAAARTPGERASLAETIATQRDPETFPILARLYGKEPDVSVREALIAGLAEVDEEEHTPAKIKLLGGALKKEPRKIRRAALEVLAQIDTPEALALLKTAAREDADSQIREAAKAFLADQ